MIDTASFIIKDTLICGGAPTIKGRRLTVYNVVSELRDVSAGDIQDHWYKLSLDEINAALYYCKYQICKIKPPAHFCVGCSLHRINEVPTFKEFLDESGLAIDDAKNVVPKEGNAVYLGDLPSLMEEWSGEDAWSTASSILSRLYESGQVPKGQEH